MNAFVRLPRRLVMAALVGLTLAAVFPGQAAAQFRDGYNFLKALRDRDFGEAAKLLRDETSRVINTRDITTQETGLAIVVQARNLEWTRFLLARGANPALADRSGNTPLMHSILRSWPEGAEALLARGAQIDQTNSRGETALILAVQKRDTAMVRLLMARRANPDKSDHIAGMSARDYAKRDDRTGALLALLDAKPDGAKPLGPVFGPN